MTVGVVARQFDRDAVIDHIVESERPYAGPGNVDEPRLRAIAGPVFDRTNDIAASLTNHFLLDSDGPGDPRPSRLERLPTLVLHGTADPLFPLAHGRALADAIPGARLIELHDVGHRLPPPHTWERLIDTLLDHTAEAWSAGAGTCSLAVPRAAPATAPFRRPGTQPSAVPQRIRLRHTSAGRMSSPFEVSG